MQLAAKINPGVSFIGEVQSFVKQVSDAVAAQELREWEQQVQEYNDRMEAAKKQADRNYQLEQIRIRAYRDVAVEYAKNQPKEIYNTLII
jgi:TRAP-type C4-dicarboxylate transport system substrate-binding protein